MSGRTFLLRCRRGLAAVEFALLLPMMVTLFFAILEMGNFLTVHRKIVQATQNAADLLTQEKTLGNANFDDVTEALRVILRPFPDATLAYRVTSVVYNATSGAATVGWEKSYGTLGTTPDGPTSTAAGLGLPGESSLVVNLSYVYTPLFTHIVPSTISIGETAIARPRRVRVIPCTASGC
jgi:Flp pilus assembly protein TadG